MTAFPPRSAPLHLGAFGLAASAALVVLFVLCWIVAAVIPSLGASHGWIALFTTAPVSSVRALVSLEHCFWLDNRSGDGAYLQSDRWRLNKQTFRPYSLMSAITPITDIR